MHSEVVHEDGYSLELILSSKIKNVIAKLGLVDRKIMDLKVFNAFFFRYSKDESKNWLVSC